ncbi:MAG: tyrosine-type recombinase/integrase [Hyphomicrobium sp.]|jgi:integrase
MADAVTPLFAPVRNGHTFRSAAASYIEHGGETRYLPRIIAYLEDRPLTAIAPFDIRQMATELYPSQSNATRNRHAITPARAVLSHAYDRGWGPMMRIRNFKVDKPRRKVPASPVWMFAFLRQCEIDGLLPLAALVLFMHQTGARVSEAIALRWPEVDLINRRVTLLKTKTSTFSIRHLTDELVTRVAALDRNEAKPAFGYRSRYSINDRIAAVCARADITYKSSHLVGRHSFATNAISGGIDIKTAMDAGDWRSVSVFVETYVHTLDASRTVADQFNAMRYDAKL